MALVRGRLVRGRFRFPVLVLALVPGRLVPVPFRFPFPDQGRVPAAVPVPGGFRAWHPGCRGVDAAGRTGLVSGWLVMFWFAWYKNAAFIVIVYKKQRCFL